CLPREPERQRGLQTFAAGARSNVRLCVADPGCRPEAREPAGAGEQLDIAEGGRTSSAPRRRAVQTGLAGVLDSAELVARRGKGPSRGRAAIDEAGRDACGGRTL